MISKRLFVIIYCSVIAIGCANDVKNSSNAPSQVEYSLPCNICIYNDSITRTRVNISIADFQNWDIDSLEKAMKRQQNKLDVLIEEFKKDDRCDRSSFISFEAQSKDLCMEEYSFNFIQDSSERKIAFGNYLAYHRYTNFPVGIMELDTSTLEKSDNGNFLFKVKGEYVEIAPENVFKYWDECKNSYYNGREYIDSMINVCISEIVGIEHGPLNKAETLMINYHADKIKFGDYNFREVLERDLVLQNLKEDFNKKTLHSTYKVID